MQQHDHSVQVLHLNLVNLHLCNVNFVLKFGQTKTGSEDSHFLSSKNDLYVRLVQLKLTSVLSKEIKGFAIDAKSLMYLR